jgi:S-formylglutathione hydrolase FrmB
VTAGPLPDQTDKATVVAMQAKGTVPATGTVVPVNIGDAGSHFRHRGELVYLPPAWYATNPPPRLPTVMMIGGEFNTPADWLRVGNAIKTVDDFAAAHGGYAPVLVFVDSGGAFNNDTECVNGPRGNAADHLTKDVVPFMVSNFGVSPSRANWGVAGWSMGGTCALDLTVMHPDMFSAFEDIAGDLSPNSGTKAQTIARLFGGNADAWAAFDPSTVISRHGRYTDVAGWFAVHGGQQAQPHVTPAVNRGPPNPGDQTFAANALCGLGSTHGIDCAVVAQAGKHDWPFAARAFAAALPWLAGQLGTPGAPRIPFPPSAPAAHCRPRLRRRDSSKRQAGNPPAYRGGMADEPTPADPGEAPKPAPAAPLSEPNVDPGYSQSGVPTFESVREKIETRYGTSLGAAELDAESPEGRTVDEQYEARKRAAADRLEQIRESMHRDDA